MYVVVPSVKSQKMKSGSFALKEKYVVFFNKVATNAIQELKTFLQVIDSEGSKLDIDFIIDERLPFEGYTLQILPAVIKIFHRSQEGAFWAVKTLKQIFVQAVNNQIQCLEIIDSPTFRIRGFMMDISRDKIPSMKTIFQVIDLLSDLKYNHFELYVEGFSFKYPSFDQLYQPEDTPVTINEYKRIEKYCYGKMIDFVPNHNGFGHMAEWLAKDEFKDLAETPDGFFIWGAHRRPSTLNPLDDRSVELVKKIYTDALKASNSAYFNMNFDEPFELGHGKSKDKCEEVGVGRVYVEYMMKLYQHLKQYHKTPMIWGDVLNHHPEELENIPKDIIFLDWGYDMDYPYDKNLKRLDDAKVKFMAAPGTSSWCSITGRTFDMLETIKNASFYTKKYNGIGLMLTDWGDVGHLQYLPISYPGIVYSAMESWSTNLGNYKHISYYLDQFVFKDQNKVLGNLLLDLGTYNRYENRYVYNGTATFHSLIWAEHGIKQEDPLAYFKGKMKQNVFRLHQYQMMTEEFKLQLERLKKTHLGCDDSKIILKEMRQSIYLLMILQKFIMTMSDELTLVEKQKYIGEVIDKLPKLISSHQFIWLQRNRRGGLNKSKQRLENLLEIARLMDQELNINHQQI
jgi:hexosaminidase